MGWQQKVHGGILGFVGFMLSPLSWWKDAFVNLPLALAFAWGISLFYRPAFKPAVIIGYWLTNVLGFVLMHKGAIKIVTGKAQRTYSRSNFLRDLLISLLYTLLILLLLKLEVLKPLTDYFRANSY